MKKNFFDKYRNDLKYRAKIKLILYGIFIIIITIYATTLNSNIVIPDNETISNNIDDNNNTNFINISNINEYSVTVNIDDKIINYSYDLLIDKTVITKTIDNVSTNYIYQNNEYYVEDFNLYLKTTKEEVYDIVNYNYLNLDNISSYMSKAINENNQYIIYIKDIVLNQDTNDYFVILVNDNEINIDYTPLVKLFNNNIKKYKVNIKIEEYKEVN